MTMTAVDTGIQGAKRQSFHKASPRGVLMALINENPRAPESTLLRLFGQKIKEDAESGDDYLSPIIEYWFAHNYPSLMKGTRTPAAKRAAKQAARVKDVEIAEKVTARIRQEAQIILLDMVLPNGKALRDCTGRDCSKLGGKVGAWLTKIAGKVKPGEVVGDVLDEAQVRKLYGR